MYHLSNAARRTLWLVLQSWPPVLHTQLPAQTHSCGHQEAPSKATVLRQLSSEKKVWNAWQTVAQSPFGMGHKPASAVSAAFDVDPLDSLLGCSELSRDSGILFAKN